MNGDVETEAPRPRPLSGGLWTLFSWLRRDERSSSSDSLSSAGSDRTVASFAYLAPTHYRSGNPPLVLPPPGPPTDSYKKRVQDRNIRRHHDRDLTLHRKYGLYRSEVGNGYDAFSLPPVRSGDSSSRWDRERRAASECYPRRERAVHVPGKRRAPPPPSAPTLTPCSGPSATTLPRRSTRKRPAPQPPIKFEKAKENIEALERTSNISIHMNQQPTHDKQPLPNNDRSTGCKSEKYTKRDAIVKDSKNRSEKSFLKQIFENRKRNSAIEISSVKFLPSISELDKQAAEIIESCKRKELEQNNNFPITGEIKMNPHAATRSSKDMWYCTRCLKKYNASVTTCEYCIPVQRSTVLGRDIIKKAVASNDYTQTENGSLPNKTTGPDERQKLREMLKEMKDSLPKRPKHDSVETKVPHKSIETPTLRIGSTVPDQLLEKKIKQPQPSSSKIPSTEILDKKEMQNTKPISLLQTVLVTQPVVLTHQVNSNMNVKSDPQNQTNIGNVHKIPGLVTSFDNTDNKSHFQISTIEKRKLNTPLKISSLLNPVYIPFSKNSNASKSSTTPQEVKIQQEPIKNPIKLQDNIKIPAIPTVECKSGINTVQINAKAIKEECKKQETAAKQPILQNMGLSNKNTGEKVVSLHTKELPSESPIPCPKKTPTSNFVKSRNSIIEKVDQHSRRRDLINQLEKSIASGNERAAAEAAVKLAQLRLSCSVLSFSSQIVGEASTSGSKLIGENVSINDNKHNEAVNSKVNTAGQSTNVSSNDKLSQFKTNDIINAKVAPLQTVTKTDEADKTKFPIHNKAITNTFTTPNVKASTSKQAATTENDMIPVVVWVEDREAARGPVTLRIQKGGVMGDLRREAETSLGLAARLQRWIVGRTLSNDDNTPLVSLAGPDFSAPFYLCLVESETKARDGNVVPADKTQEDDKAGKVYSELMKLEQQALVPNAEVFECDVCMEGTVPGEGVVLRECVHTFCRNCLSDVIRHSEEPIVSCPATACPGVLQEREIRALVSPEDYERWLARSLAAAESGTRNAFHCRTRDCTGWALCEPGVRQFPCPVCKRTNCVPCQAIHEGDTCEQYKMNLQQSVKTTENESDESTLALLDTLINKGEALECPECSAIITKKWGCDWVKCSACKTEICWVTRGRRWGPGGRGDTSGGCRCGVDGRRCHPSCGYCH